MPADLHQQLLDATSGPYANSGGLDDAYAALRAVVELHAPEQIAAARAFGGVQIATACAACPPVGDFPDLPDPEEITPWPCSTVLTIARELGIQEGS